MKFSRTKITFSLLGLMALVIFLGKGSSFLRLSSNKLLAQTKTTQNAQYPHFTPKLSVHNLIMAISKGNTVIVKKLIENGVDINETDEKGDTPLIYAASNNQKNTTILKLLLGNGADVNARNLSGETALMLSMGPGGTQEGIKLLLEHSADVNIATLDGQTPLMWAAEWFDVGVTNDLLKKGAKINIQTDDGMTVLHIAAKFYRSKTVKLLLESGADPLIKTKAGQTPLLLAQATYDREKQRMNKFVKSQLTEVIRQLESAESKIKKN